MGRRHFPFSDHRYRDEPSVPAICALRGDAAMTPQSTFMVAAPIDPNDIAALEQLLERMNLPGMPGMADPKNALVPFGCFHRLHFARFVILKDDTLCDFAR